MGISENMKRIAQEIVSSYQARISTVAAIVDDTYQLLEDFKAKRNEMSSKLKEILSQEESLRKKDFDNMMAGILSHQDEREKQVKELLKTFFEEQKEIAEILKKSLSEDQTVGIDDFKKSLKDIQVRQRARENEVEIMVKEFQEEYKEMAESLRNLLNKGEVIRIKDFKKMLKEICLKQTERKEEVRKRLDEIRKEQQDMTSHWHIKSNITAKKRDERQKGGAIKEKEEVTKAGF